MGQRKRINALNDRLRQELGEQPLHSWQWSNDLRRPGLVRNSEAGLEFDYRCTCGVNVRDEDHREACSRMVIPEPRVEFASRLPHHPNRWVLCTQQLVDPTEHLIAHGTSGAYRGKVWEPLAFDRLPAPGYILLASAPDEHDNNAVIAMIREFREMSIEQWHSYMLEGEAREEREWEEHVRNRIQEALGITPHPEQKSFMSFPTRERDKQGATACLPN